jgi:hypothetical protein
VAGLFWDKCKADKPNEQGDSFAKHGKGCVFFKFVRKYLDPLKPIYLSTAEPIHISQFFFKKIHTSSFFRLMNYAAVSGPTAAASPLHVGSTHPPATAVSGEPWQVLYKLAESRADRGERTNGARRVRPPARRVTCACAALPATCLLRSSPSSVLLLFFSRPRPDSRDRIMCRNLIHNEQEKTSGWHRVIFLGVLDNKPPKNKRNRNFCSLFLVGVKTEIPHRPSFVSGKIWETMKNCSSQKWYGNKKILMEMEMKMIVALYR